MTPNSNVDPVTQAINDVLGGNNPPAGERAPTGSSAPLSAGPAPSLPNELPISELRIHPDLSSVRSKETDKLFEKIVDDYNEAMKDEDIEVVVANCLTDLNIHGSVLDGFHRLAVAKRRKHQKIRTVWLTVKNLQEAILEALRLNSKHGLRLRPEERKEKAKWLKATFPEMPQTEMARILSVNQKSISNWVRAKSESSRVRRNYEKVPTWKEIRESLKAVQKGVLEVTSPEKANEVLPHVESLLQQLRALTQVASSASGPDSGSAPETDPVTVKVTQ
jgi:predicted regulator of amino acid metabolism with ACT domain